MSAEAADGKAPPAQPVTDEAASAGRLHHVACTIDGKADVQAVVRRLVHLSGTLAGESGVQVNAELPEIRLVSGSAEYKAYHAAQAAWVRQQTGNTPTKRKHKRKKPSPLADRVAGQMVKDYPTFDELKAETWEILRTNYGNFGAGKNIGNSTISTALEKARSFYLTRTQGCSTLNT